MISIVFWTIFCFHPLSSVSTLNLEAHKKKQIVKSSLKNVFCIKKRAVRSLNADLQYAMKKCCRFPLRKHSFQHSRKVSHVMRVQTCHTQSGISVIRTLERLIVHCLIPSLRAFSSWNSDMYLSWRSHSIIGKMYPREHAMRRFLWGIPPILEDLSHK